MREIKFRVWFKDSMISNPKLMFNVEYRKPGLILGNWEDTKFDYILTLDGEHFSPRAGFVLQQYTGLKDKNNKEIYEGDIVQLLKILKNQLSGLTVDMHKAVVEAKEAYFGVKYNADCFEVINRFMEVIGNVYENPELVEDKENKDV